MAPDRGTARHWGLIVAAVGGLLSAGAVLANPPSDPHAATANASPERQTIGPGPLSSPIPAQEPIYTSNYQRACQQPESAIEADLCQQWRSANAAEGMLNLANWQFWASAIGAFISALAAFFTGWAAYAAAKAARSAEAAVDITRELGQTELRAYISVPRSNIQDLAPNTLPYAHIAIKNTGTTPALEMQTAISIVPREFPNSEPIEHAKVLVGPKSKSTLGGGQETTVFAKLRKPLSKRDIDRLRSGELAIYVLGTIEYKDVFGRPWQTKFCMVWGGDADTSQTAFAHCAEGNEAT